MSDVSSKENDSLAFLNLFFPIHYIAGIQVEDALRSGVLTRHQACILWTIRARGYADSSIRRKDIERDVASWYEVNSSEISKALRGLARPPFDYISIVENPQSGREKLISLTPEGKIFLGRMMDNGIEIMDKLVDALSEEERRNGIHFLTRASELFKGFAEDEKNKANRTA